MPQRPNASRRSVVYKFGLPKGKKFIRYDRTASDQMPQSGRHLRTSPFGLRGRTHDLACPGPTSREQISMDAPNVSPGADLGAAGRATYALFGLFSAQILPPRPTVLYNPMVPRNLSIRNFSRLWRWPSFYRNLRL